MVCIMPVVLWPNVDLKGLLLGVLPVSFTLRENAATSGWLKEAETDVLGRSRERLYNAGLITKIDCVWKTVLGGVTGSP